MTSQVASYLGYIALKEHFPKMALKPNPECTSYWCRKQQAAYAKRAAEAKANAPPPPPEPEPEPEPDFPNEWGIEIVGDDEDEQAGGSSSAAGGDGASQLAEGVMFAHVSSSQLKPEVKAEDTVATENGLDLGDLMAQLQGLQK